MSKRSKAGENPVRITSIIVLGGVTYQPNDLVHSIPDAELKELIDTGKALDSEANIAYCLEALGIKPVKCGDPRYVKKTADNADEALSE